MKGKIVVPHSTCDQYPPVGSVGIIWGLTNGKIAFVPDDPDHLPPGCPPEEFGFYEMEPNEVEEVK